MQDFILLMWKPLLACFILTGIHAYLGLHVVERKVIFVDLALAQIAALGATIAILFGWDVHGPAGYWLSLGATILGAILFALTRSRQEKVPQEATIGIVYAVSAALAILILSRVAEGDEHIRHMLVGHILLVDSSEILKMAVLYGAVGWIHWKFRNPLILISTRPEEAREKGISLRKWDFLFYLTFGVVVTSSVESAGVLLVFSYLIVPAVTAMLLAQSFFHRLLIGWTVGILTSLAGVSLSYCFDFPTGAAIVCTFGLAAALCGVLKKITHPRRMFL